MASRGSWRGVRPRDGKVGLTPFSSPPARNYLPHHALEPGGTWQAPLGPPLTLLRLGDRCHSHCPGPDGAGPKPASCTAEHTARRVGLPPGANLRQQARSQQVAWPCIIFPVDSPPPACRSLWNRASWPQPCPPLPRVSFSPFLFYSLHPPDPSCFRESAPSKLTGTQILISVSHAGNPN